MKHVKVERYEPEVRTLKPGLFRLDPARVYFFYEKTITGHSLRCIALKMSGQCNKCRETKYG
jgi:hypothetical protein